MPPKDLFILEEYLGMRASDVPSDQAKMLTNTYSQRRTSHYVGHSSQGRVILDLLGFLFNQSSHPPIPSAPTVMMTCSFML